MQIIIKKHSIKHIHDLLICYSSSLQQSYSMNTDILLQVLFPKTVVFHQLVVVCLQALPLSYCTPLAHAINFLSDYSQVIQQEFFPPVDAIGRKKCFGFVGCDTYIHTNIHTSVCAHIIFTKCIYVNLSCNGPSMACTWNRSIRSSLKIIQSQNLTTWHTKRNNLHKNFNAEWAVFSHFSTSHNTQTI